MSVIIVANRKVEKLIVLGLAYNNYKRIIYRIAHIYVIDFQNIV